MSKDNHKRKYTQDVFEESSSYFEDNSKVKKTTGSGVAYAEQYFKSKKRLSYQDYDKKGLDLAKDLLGKIIVRIDGKDNTLLCARIVETEAYIGITDKACHSYGNKKTDRTKPMFMSAGTSYVYTIYGMYFCLNISSADEGGCVLIRGAEPLQGIDIMRTNRSKKIKKQKLLDHHLCSGPSKLCQAMNITKDLLNALDLTTDKTFFLLDDYTLYEDDEIIICKRIGIEGYGEESAALPYRFYVKGNKNVSVRNKKAEQVE